MHEWTQTAVFLAGQPLLVAVLSAVLGLLVGSFINVVILRWPPRLLWAWRADARAVLDLPDENTPQPPGFVVDRSHCPGCGHTLSWWENLPLLSFMALRGRCRACSMRISWQYPLVEALGAAVPMSVMAVYAPGWPALMLILAGWLLLTLSAIDVRTQLLPDQLVYVLLWSGLAAPAFGLRQAPSTSQAIIGAILGYGLLWSVSWIFSRVRGKQGMGHGDFKLLAAIGAWSGPLAIFPVIAIASVVGAVYGIAVMLLFRTSSQKQVPFGPFLAIAAWMQWLHPIVLHR